MSLQTDGSDQEKTPDPEYDIRSGKRVIDSRDLFQDDREIIIAHGESFYRLQITKLGKLILIK